MNWVELKDGKIINLDNVESVGIRFDMLRVGFVSNKYIPITEEDFDYIKKELRMSHKLGIERDRRR